jgi:hypothetical protein
MQFEYSEVFVADDTTDLQSQAPLLKVLNESGLMGWELLDRRRTISNRQGGSYTGWSCLLKRPIVAVPPGANVKQEITERPASLDKMVKEGRGEKKV